jgi:hypothetical protein
MVPRKTGSLKPDHIGIQRATCATRDIQLACQVVLEDDGESLTHEM